MTPTPSFLFTQSVLKGKQTDLTFVLDKQTGCCEPPCYCPSAYKYVLIEFPDFFCTSMLSQFI